MKPARLAAALFMKLGILFNGVGRGGAGGPDRPLFVLVGHARPRRMATSAWVPLGRVSEFPEGETRLATFRNPFVMPTDGKTADAACWVRRIEGERFQVFAVNCAHLGCPVRWFPQSGLFMCPCHGGAYYRDGSRASGPPERGLFEYPIKSQDGVAHDSGRRAADARAECRTRSGETAMRLIARDRRVVRPPPAARGADSRRRGTSGAAQHGELVVRLRQRRAGRVLPAARDRHPSRDGVRALRGRGMEQPAGVEPPGRVRLVRSRAARMGIELHGRDRPHPHGAGLPVRRLQVSARADVDRRRLSPADDARHGVHRADAALRPGCVLGSRDRRLDREPRARRRARRSSS